MTRVKEIVSVWVWNGQTQYSRKFPEEAFLSANQEDFLYKDPSEDKDDIGDDDSVWFPIHNEK